MSGTSLGFVDVLKKNASAPPRPVTSKGVLALTALAALGIASAWFYFFVSSSVERGNARIAASTPRAPAPGPSVPVPVDTTIPTPRAGRTPTSKPSSLVSRIRRGDLNETPN